MLPVFVINLDRRPDRWQAISADLDRIGVVAERIPALDARELAGEVRLGRRPPGRVNLGSAANAMGHANAMRRLLESDSPAALILEDDAELSRDTATLLHSVDWWPHDAKVVRLEHGFGKLRLCGRAAASTPNGRQLRHLARWIGGSSAYLINRDGARIALQALVDPQLTIDMILFDLRYSRMARLLRPYQILPAMARQRGMGSDILPWYSRERGLRRRSVAQVAMAIPFKLRILLLRAAGQIHQVDVIYRDTVD